MGLISLLFLVFMVGYFVFLWIKNRKLPYASNGVTESKLFDDRLKNTMGDISLSNSWNIGKTD